MPHSTFYPDLHQKLGGLFWVKTYPPSKFPGNLFSSFCVTLVTNQPIHEVVQLIWPVLGPRHNKLTVNKVKCISAKKTSLEHTAKTSADGQPAYTFCNNSAQYWPKVGLAGLLLS